MQLERNSSPLAEYPDKRGLAWESRRFPVRLLTWGQPMFLLGHQVKACTHLGTPSCCAKLQFCPVPFVIRGGVSVLATSTSRLAAGPSTLVGAVGNVGWSVLMSTTASLECA